MNSSESGRKLNQAVNTTSKAVGGALSQAKGAFSNLWSAITTPSVIATTPPIYQPNNNQSNSTAKSASQEENENADVNSDNTIRDYKSNGNTNKKIVNENTENQISCNKLNESTLKEEKGQQDVNNDGIVEIGREAGILDSNRKNSAVLNI